MTRSENAFSLSRVNIPACNPVPSRPKSGLGRAGTGLRHQMSMRVCARTHGHRQPSQVVPRPRSDAPSACPLNVRYFSHLTPIGVRENEKISRASQEFLMRK